jgi:hypothetical protein
LVLDHVYDGRGGHDVQHFHTGVVDGVKCGEEVQVPGDEYEEEQFMRSYGDTVGILRDAQSE